MRSMNDAPKDGTRILIKTNVYHFSQYGKPYELTGTQIIECWYDGAKWQEWCGDKRITSIGTIEPLGWMPIPEEMK